VWATLVGVHAAHNVHSSHIFTIQSRHTSAPTAKQSVRQYRLMPWGTARRGRSSCAAARIPHCGAPATGHPFRVGIGLAARERWGSKFPSSALLDDQDAVREVAAWCDCCTSYAFSSSAMHWDFLMKSRSASRSVPLGASL